MNTPSQLSEQKWAIWGAIGVVLIWSHWIIVSRLGVSTSLSPLDISMLRFATAALITLPIWLRYKWGQVHWGKSIIVAMGIGTPYTLLSFYGMQSAKAARAGILINGLLPVFGALLAMLWLGHRLKKKHLLGICIVLVANGLMLYYSDFQISSSVQVFALVCLVSASCVYSVYMAAVKRWGFTFQDVIAQIPIINCMVLLPFWLAFDSHIDEASIGAIALQSVYQGVIVTLIAGTLVTYSIQKLGSVTTSLFMAFVPAMAAILGFVYLNEALSVVEVCAIALCTIGIVIYTKA